MASLFKVKALYEFEAKEDDDLGFPVGQVIDVTEEIDDNWLEGRYTDAVGGSQSGIFPREFVEKYEPEVPVRPARPTRPKQEPAPVQEPPAAVQHAEEVDEDKQPPPLPALSKPQPPPVESTAPSRQEPTEPLSPPAVAPAKAEPPPAPKPAPAEPAAPASGKKPPPVAAKSNAFRDRIAAFNQPAAAPIAPMVPGGSRAPQAYIKKPFVAPPPLANSYVPPPKVEPVHKPYIREEDPEIRQRQEEDHAAAEAAGFTNAPSAEQGEEDEDAPKPTSLKERIARLQQQQMEQAQRRAEGGHKKERKPPAKKPSESSDLATLEPEEGGPPRQRSMDIERQSLDISREKPRVPSAHHRPAEPMSPTPAAPDHELVSDGNEADQSAAGETTEDDAGTIGPEDSDEKHAPTPLPRAARAPKREPDVGDEEDAAEEVEEDEDTMDEETRRRMELRERMAKMSGGMGMAGMFGPPGAMTLPGAGAKKRTTKEKKPSEDEQPLSTSPPVQRTPMIPVPGMNRVQSPDSDVTQTEREREDDEEDDAPAPRSRKSTNLERGAPPPVPSESRPSLERGPPPLVPGSGHPAALESRPVPPPPATPMSPDPGAESDDEASIDPSQSVSDTPVAETPGPLPIRGAAPPVPISTNVQSPESKRLSYFGNDSSSTTSDKRASRVPPPVPGSPVTSPRPPPPPPPTAQVSRSATTHEDDQERRESDYEGDYDTDIASGAKHKEALKAHVREPSLDDSTTADDTPLTPPAPPPHSAAPRAVPPPPPPQAAPKARPSMDAPRAPPPVPPVTSLQPGDDDDDYDPYRYDGRERGPPPPVPAATPMAAPRIPPRDAPPTGSTNEQSIAPQTRMSVEQGRPEPPKERAAPPQHPHEAASQRAPPRQSLDVQRSNTTARRSTEIPRPSGENGQIANDIDLGENTQWYTDPQPLPPVLQSRNGIDILSECEESTTSKRGGRTTVVKDIYVLFIDYSQSIITVQYDSKDPSDAHLEQRHLPPPPKLRQDQLESYWQRFGSKVSEKANSLGQHKESPVGDGSPSSLVAELVQEHQDALQPVGQRAYGALVYANLANASTMQFDEIRPGDIVTLRNARFEGSHGAMKHKYRQEYGPSHVAIVEEWDGTRRSIRAWEQGREKKEKVRSEKFRLGDLKSGEVRVWRIVGRDWVDWQS